MRLLISRHDFFVYVGGGAGVSLDQFYPSLACMLVSFLELCLLPSSYAISVIPLWLDLTIQLFPMRFNLHLPHYRPLPSQQEIGE